jgi:DNA-binding transcriptional regulator LsrR (DeoR family)
VSVTPQQRAQVLYLHHVEGVSIVLIAAMTGLGRSVVRRVLHETSRHDVPAASAAARRPQEKGRIERQIHSVREQLLRPSTVVPSRRRQRRERRHDRT